MVGWLWPSGLFFSTRTGVAGGPAALVDSEDPALSSFWALWEVELPVGDPGREGVGGGGSAGSTP